MGDDETRRLRIEIDGAVQGVGFRPFVYRLARELGLTGWVANDERGVTIDAAGSPAALDSFLVRLRDDAPRAAVVERLDSTRLTPEELPAFEIRRSDRAGAPTVQMLPDLATCDDCLAELLEPADRRHRYPFTNCTLCGPRLSIIRALPYDRASTTMATFEMCDACRTEYEDPADRRFHAQPNACPVCGPRLELLDADGTALAEGDDALRAAAREIADGRIVAVKGLGGFHLVVDARDGAAIDRLRTRKVRRDKPLALLVRDLEQAEALAEIDATTAETLRSPAAPIVLAPARPGTAVDAGVAPDCPTLGVMLPANPLHHLLMRELDGPVVATSGNLSDEPICIDEREALVRLAGIADRFLIHDRPIERQVDDSIVRVLDGAPTILRRARGYAPRPIDAGRELPAVLGVGAHLKNAVAFAVGRHLHVSQHVGDMETPESAAAFERIVRDALDVYALDPVAIAHDLHPEYVSTRWAERSEWPRIAVQHHHAHLASCLVDRGHDGGALGLIWDGTGLGTDGTIWGGEFLLGDASSFRRVGRLRPFALPGGDAAIREPRRSAAAVLFELDGTGAILDPGVECLERMTTTERRVLARMLERGTNAPRTTSMGRLFDAVAAIVGLHPTSAFEGQAAMALEAAADRSVRDGYPVSLDDDDDGTTIVDWEPLVRAVLDDARRGREIGTIAGRFHASLADVGRLVAGRVGHGTVALSGGCFQNGLLVERLRRGLESDGFEVLTHRVVPPNDGGIAVGQVVVAAAALSCADEHRGA